MKNEFLRYLITVARTETAAEIAYDALKRQDEVPFLISLGCIVDRWAAEHGKTQEETFEMMQKIAAVQQMVHEEIGPYRQKERAPRDKEQNVS